MIRYRADVSEPPRCDIRCSSELENCCMERRGQLRSWDTYLGCILHGISLRCTVENSLHIPIGYALFYGYDRRISTGLDEARH